MKFLIANILLALLVFPLTARFIPRVSNPHKHGTLEWARKQHDLWNEFEKTKPINLPAQAAGFMMHVAPMSQTHVFSFDGTDDFITFGDVLDKERTDAFSMSTWVYSISGGSRTIFGKLADISGSFRGYLLDVAPSQQNKIRFLLVNDFTGNNRIELTTTNNDLSLSTWTHIVVTYSGSSAASGVKIYVDSSSKALTTVADTLNATTVHSQSFRVGAYNQGSYYYGKISEPTIYNKELSATEVAALYTSRFTGQNIRTLSFGSNAEFWLTANPPSTTGSGGVKDLSGNGYNGTLTNGASIIADRGPFTQ